MGIRRFAIASCRIMAASGSPCQLLACLVCQSSMKITIPILAIANLIIYIFRAGLAGCMLNDIFNAEQNGEIRGDTNNVTDLLVQTTLILCMIGSASSILAALHFKAYNNISRAASFGVSLIALNLNILVLCYASKQWDLGCKPDKGCTDRSLGWRAQLTGILAVAQFLFHGLLVESIYTLKPEEDLDKNAPEVGDHSSASDSDHEGVSVPITQPSQAEDPAQAGVQPSQEDVNLESPNQI